MRVGIEEPSASFEARSAPRSYATVSGTTSRADEISGWVEATMALAGAVLAGDAAGMGVPGAISRADKAPGWFALRVALAALADEAPSWIAGAFWVGALFAKAAFSFSSLR